MATISSHATRPASSPSTSANHARRLTASSGSRRRGPGTARRSCAPRRRPNRPDPRVLDERPRWTRRGVRRRPTRNNATSSTTVIFARVSPFSRGRAFVDSAGLEERLELVSNDDRSVGRVDDDVESSRATPRDYGRDDGPSRRNAKPDETRGGGVVVEGGRPRSSPATAARAMRNRRRFERVVGTRRSRRIAQTRVSAVHLRAASLVSLTSRNLPRRFSFFRVSSGLNPSTATSACAFVPWNAKLDAPWTLSRVPRRVRDFAATPIFRESCRRGAARRSASARAAQRTRRRAGDLAEMVRGAAAHQNATHAE